MAITQTCQACGTVILPEQIDVGQAGRWGGQMLCPACYAAKRGPKPAEPAPAAPVPAAPAASAEDEPISLVDASDGGPAGSKIQALSGSKIHVARTNFKRKTTVTGQGASRVRTFHSKIQAESIEFMDNAINDWLDENPDVEVKFVTTTVGTMAGKFPEPNIILNVWY